MTREVVEIDPALRRLLDTLPHTDPDAPEHEPEWCEVWIPNCDGRHMRPIGVPVDIDFGPWQGPPTPSEEVTIYVRNIRTNRLLTVRFGDLNWRGPPIMEPGCTITASNNVFRV